MRWQPFSMLACTSALALTVLAAGCEKSEQPAPSPSPSAAASAAAAPSASAAQSAQAWYLGAWSGSYESRHHLIEMDKKQGGVKAWSEDDGNLGSGKGMLTLNVAEDRVVTGSAIGPLGEMTASGQLDEDTLRVRLSPTSPTAENSFAGFLIAQRKGEGFVGTLNASTGDSNTVRDAPVRLSKAGK